jgi:two-component system KDP operon response regulator KdpE
MQNKSTVLIAESNPETSNSISSALLANGYRPLAAENGSTAISMISSHCPDIVLLDQALPDMEGLEVLRTVRQWTRLPIIILSPRGNENEEVKALDMGADDYIMKPFGFSELLARIRMALRHSVKMETGDDVSDGILQCGGLTIDLMQHSVAVDGRKVHLTQNEYRIVLLLAKHPGKVLTYSDIIEQVWGHFAVDDRQILRVNMANIRKKIERDPADPKYIVTEIGVGYRMAAVSEDSPEEQDTV